MRNSFNGKLLQLFPLSDKYLAETTGAGSIDVTKKRCIHFFDDCNISIDGGLQVPVVAGSTYAIEPDASTIEVDAAVRYGIF